MVREFVVQFGDLKPEKQGEILNRLQIDLGKDEELLEALVDIAGEKDARDVLEEIVDKSLRESSYMWQVDIKLERGA